MAKKKNKTVSDNYTVAMILSLIYQEFYGFNPENKIALFLVTESDLLTLSGMPELTDEFVCGLKNRLLYLGFYFLDAEYGWFLVHETDFDGYPRLPQKLVESLSPGFVDSFFAESISAAKGKAYDQKTASNK